MKLQQESYGFELTEYLACFSCWAKYLSRERFLIIFVGFFSTVWFRSGSWEGVNWLIYKAEVVSIFVICSIMDLFLNLFYWKFLQCFPNLYRNPILHQMPSFNFATPVFPHQFSPWFFLIVPGKRTLSRYVFSCDKRNTGSQRGKQHTWKMKLLFRAPYTIIEVLNTLHGGQHQWRRCLDH